MLDAWFGGRERDLEGEDGNPMNEVRVIADSVVGNASTLRVLEPVRWAPERTVLRFAVGDEVEMSADGFERLAAAYLAAIENTYLVIGG